MSTGTISAVMNDKNELVCADSGAYSGEHNAQTLEITLNEDFASDSYSFFTLAFDTGGFFGKSTSDEIGSSKEEPIYKDGNKIYCALTQSLTASGALRVQLSAYGESGGVVTRIKKSGILDLTFKPSINAPSAPPSLEADLIAKIGAAVSGIERLSEEIQALSHLQITAGDYLNLKDGVMSVNVAGSLNGGRKALASCETIKAYCDNAVITGFSAHNATLCAGVVAKLKKGIDENCLEVFIEHGNDVVVVAAFSGIVQEILCSEGSEDKYFLLVPLTNAIQAQLYMTTQDYIAGNIYKVMVDKVNDIEVVTEYSESSFAQMLGLGA